MKHTNIVKAFEISNLKAEGHGEHPEWRRGWSL